MDNNTIVFSLNNNKDEDMRKTLIAIYDALVEKGYDPIDQIVGYILSEDPTYITNHKNARSLIRKLDRHELLASLVNNYLKG
ncbi:MAG: IreB family regulatory phosphoprotein [Clostridia bacterium]|nr:IreB family regulatory phosphoprotein [Clostridia bacterium]